MNAEKSSKNLTFRQQGFVRDYLETGNASLAARQNYNVSSPETARVIGCENLKKPVIQKTIQQSLETRGLTNELIADRILDLINAKKKITLMQKGDVTAVREEIDTYAVKTGLDFALRFVKTTEKENLPISILIGMDRSEYGNE